MLQDFIFEIQIINNKIHEESGNLEISDFEKDIEHCNHLYQISVKKKIAYCDFLIVNNKSKNFLKKKVNDIIKK